MVILLPTQTLPDNTLCFASCCCYSAFFSLSILAILILNIKLFLRTRKEQSTVIMALNLIANVFGFIGAILLLYIISFTNSQSDPHIHSNAVPVIIATFFINVLMIVCIYVTFMVRLQQAFADSIYQLSISVYVLLSIFITGYIVIYIFILYTRIMISQSSGRHHGKYKEHLANAYSAVNIVIPTLSVTMMVIFNSKLFRLINNIRTPRHTMPSTTRTTSSTRSSVRHSSGDKIAINVSETIVLSPAKISFASVASASAPHDFYNDKQQELLHVVVKITVLCTVAMVAKIVLHIVFIALHEDSSNQCQDGILHTLQTFYAFIEILCVSLNFAFHAQIFNHLCSACIKCCDELCQCTNYWYTILKEKKKQRKATD